MKLLHLIATPRGEKSRTLRIAHEFLQSEIARTPGLVIDTLDLSQATLPAISGAVVDAKYTLIGGGILDVDTQAAWEEIVAYAQDFLSYDYYLISSPMWNFSVPYQLKHYIDVIMQPGILFKFTEQGVEGLAKDKRMFCITTRGSDYSHGTFLQQFDFQEPYLRAIFGMAGIRDVTFLNAQPMDYAPDITQSNLNKAIVDVQSLLLTTAA